MLMMTIRPVGEWEERNEGAQLARGQRAPPQNLFYSAILCHTEPTAASNLFYSASPAIVHHIVPPGADAAALLPRLSSSVDPPHCSGTYMHDSGPYAGIYAGIEDAIFAIVYYSVVDGKIVKSLYLSCLTTRAALYLIRRPGQEELMTSNHTSSPSTSD